MMLHNKIEKHAYIISLGFVLANSFFHTFSHLRNPFYEVQNLPYPNLSSYFIGNLLGALVKIYLFSYCFKILLERMGYHTIYKKILSILLISSFLPFLISPIFRILMSEHLYSEFNIQIEKALSWITVSFLLIGYIYFIKALRMEFKFTFRKAFFTTLFIGIMFFFATSPFFGFEL